MENLGKVTWNIKRSWSMWSCIELPILFSKRSTSPQLWPSPPWCWLRGIESTWNSAEGAQLGIHKWKHLIFSWHFNSRNRDAEAKLMANEEGWEVGTWYGHPIYKVSSYSLIHELGARILSTRYHHLCDNFLILEFKALFSSWYFRPLGTSGSMLLLMNSTLIATSEISSLCAAEDDPNHVWISPPGNKREKQPTSSTGSSGIRWNQSASTGLMGLGLEWKQELSEKSSMCLTNRGRSNFVLKCSRIYTERK